MVRLHVGHQQSQFWLILAHFMDYYSPFWGREAISIVVEPQDALMCQLSTLTVLADSGPFHGLLLTVLANPGCVYVSIGNTRSFGRFWPVSRTITHCFGVPE